MAKEKLILLDFSGTLSIEAVNFGQKGTLFPYLEESGLVELGVASEEFFWREIVTPTWQEGSTTRRGYINILTERITALRRSNPQTEGNANVKRAVSLFMASYFTCCRIDETWKSMLQSLRNAPFTRVAVATDHYAEATAMIIKRMADWNIETIPLEKAVKGAENPLIVANSADIGFHKIDSRFWRAFHEQLFPPGHQEIKVLLVDDFGANEASGDHYGNDAQVTARKEKTRQALEEVWGKSVDVYPFILKFPQKDPPNSAEKKALYRSLVEQVLSYIQSFAKLPCP
jgi:hypothetical protein